MMQLKKIDSENWRFTLYESAEGNWFADFPYSPQSFIDLSILLELTDNEKANAQKNRQFLIDFSEINTKIISPEH
ncbi:hypothetical protein [Saccharicrinis fermentans]|uniref:Uncharacterized protein n=1 Tax=Saccharicrinis fermentans DSM 9555 = JCM 21142 TaxID=869213 RepID=W7YC05_9BACT|nr:hypothetical protein [Saccharicrinis fermentans]GAF05997.1 hypothetical protein JCM21142_134764 [Saccharicrinis fermentans DSM 9555 = JCM 21142]